MTIETRKTIEAGLKCVVMLALLVSFARGPVWLFAVLCGFFVLVDLVQIVRR